MKTYTREEVYAATLEYFKGDELAANVFFKYCLQDKAGRYKELTPKDMHRRLAKEFARIEQRYPNPLSEGEIFSFFDKFSKIVPQGSPMAAVGNPHQIMSTGNCFVLAPPLDSYGSICRTDQELVQLAKRRSGIGFDLSKLRPEGSKTNNAALTSGGIGPFMERYSNSCREVATKGRRGALMLSISVHHPEIRTFLNIKKDKTRVTGANISIRVTDEFMEAVEAKTTMQLRFPVDEKESPEVEEWISATKLWEDIVIASHECAEPGLIFWDTVIRNTPSDAYESFATLGCNPCSEIFMGVDSCRLMLINLYSFVVDKFTEQSRFDFEELKKSAIVLQRLMDDLIDIELEHIDRIIEKVKSDPEPAYVKEVELTMWENFKVTCSEGRRTGSGVTAVGDVIAALGMKYGDKKSIDFVEKIYKTLTLECYKSGIIMAEERGSFPVFDFDKEMKNDFLIKIYEALPPEFQKRYKKYGRRNIAQMTTAPAGSLSCETQTTSGIEPTIFLSGIRRKKVNPEDKNVKVSFVDEVGDSWEEYEIYHHGHKEWQRITGNKNDEESPYYGATAAEIDWKDSVDLQAAAQKWVCHAISKTCNLPKGVDKSVVSDLYMRAWKKGLKGLTVYVDGTRSGVLVSKEDAKVEFNHVSAPKRPTEMECDIQHMKVKGESWVFFVGLMNDKPYEVFGGLADNIEIPSEHKKGIIIKTSDFKNTANRYDLKIDGFIIKNFLKQFNNPTNQVLTRMVSLSLRHGANPEFLMSQLNKDPDNSLTSFSKVLSRVLKKYVPDGTKVESDKVCEQCGADSLVYQEGCISCSSCSWSRC